MDAFIKSESIKGINSMLRPLVFLFFLIENSLHPRLNSHCEVQTLIYCILSHSLYFFKFSTLSQNVGFHNHRSHMENGLSEVIKFCTRKMIKETLFMSPCKIVI